jgi:eukaryotic-like serine/threonine-protein kinase
MAMKTTATPLPLWTLHAPVRDNGAQPDVTLTDVAREAASIEAAGRAVAELPQLSVARSVDAELVIEGVLGKGGVGIVHVARQRALEREVAIKRLRPEGSAQAAAISSLLTEARVQGALDHPNVVPVHALGRDTDDLPVLVMKRLSGVSWRALIRDPNHPAWPKEAGDRLTWHLETLMQICNAVHFAHSRGVIHRDIKPDNVMAGAFGEVYVLDWGIAHRPRPDDPIDPTIVGTPSYLAPEMLRGTGPHLSPRTDVYLLGATLHEVLTGQVRHRGATVLEVLYDVEDSVPFDYPPSVPPELALLCNRATSRDPAARPASALEFRQAIAEYLRHKSSIALEQAATARLRELSAQGSGAPAGSALERERDAQIRRLYGEASFGFKQALLSWEGNQAAREGSEALWVWMIQYELSRRNVEGAAALLAESHRAHPALSAQIEALRVELSEEREELTNLRAIKRNLDPAVSFRPRLIVSTSVGFLVAALLFAAWRLNPTGLSHQDVILALCVVVFSLLVAIIASRKSLLMTQLNRKLVIGLLFIVAGETVNHIIAAKQLAPIDLAFTGDMLIASAITATLAVSLPVSRGFWSVPIIFLSGSLFASLWPELAVPTYIIATFLAALSVGTLSWVILRALERESIA